MATKFTPIASMPMQDTGELDNLISSIDQLRQARKQKSDEEWEKANRLRKQQEWLQEDAANAQQEAFSGAVNTMLGAPGTYKTADIDMLATQGKLSDEQRKMLNQGASDWKEASQRLMDFSSQITGSSTVDDVIAASDKAGVSLSDAMRIYNEKQSLMPKAAGTGTGTGTGTAAPTVGQAEAVNWKEQMRGAGVLIKGENIRVFGNDAYPTVYAMLPNGVQINRTRNGFEAVYKDKRGAVKKVKLTVKREKDGTTISAKGANIPGTDVIPESIVSALNEGLAKWEDVNISGKGKNTGYGNRFYQE